MDESYNKEAWYEYLDESMKRLVDESVALVEREEQLQSNFRDYSFVVFPMAKAYEGFLKKILFDAELISQEKLLGRHFRIGRSLNPDLPERYRDEDWLFDDLEKLCVRCGDEKLARRVWTAWSKGRNKLFHFFANHEDLISLKEARERETLFIEVMRRVVECMV